MASNLTRAEAAQRAGLLRVESYRVELDLAGDDGAFSSRSTVRFACASPGSDSFADLTALAVEQATLNGRELPADAFDGDRVALPGLAASNELTILARCGYSRDCSGLHRFTDPADGNVYLYTDLETFNAHRVFACFDQPDLKATFEFAVACPAAWRVVSNMPAQAGPDQAGPGTVRWHFAPTPPLPAYIAHVSAGPYHAVHEEHEGIPLGIFCRQSLAGYLDAAELFDITRGGLRYFQAAFGRPYPFAKYDQLFVPEFKAGAMENAGAVTIAEDYIFRSRVTDSWHERRAETLLHEMAHMWFGDLVTMAWWDDLWLNESFATWASLVAQAAATRWPEPWTTFCRGYKTLAYRQDQLPSTHPISADMADIASVEVNFDDITYAKGAAVLVQLVAYVGLESFLAGVRAYFDAHAWANASLADLLGALERASGRRLAQWSAAWLETAGVNTLRPEYEAGADGVIGTFTVVQQAPAAHPVLRPHRIGIGLYDLADGKLARRHRVEIDVAGERTPVPDLAGQPVPDLILVNDDDLTYAKIRLDERSLRTLSASIGAFAERLPAALCWAAAWDMCRDAELPARAYIALVLSGLESLDDVAMLQVVIGQAAHAVRRYADPAWRETGRGLLAGALLRLLRAADPGSDAQLALAQGFASVAASAEDLTLLAGLLDGSARIDGLAVDADLRWRLLRRLAGQGAAGREAIEAERDGDPTDEGHRQAEACLAAIPDPAAKAEAWSRIASGDLPYATFCATVDGFFAPDRDELVAPFAAPFFEVAAEVWQEWGVDRALYFAGHAYPATVITAAAVDAAAAYLADPALPPTLRRLVAEGRDEVARALRCRERDSLASRAAAGRAVATTAGS